MPNQPEYEQRERIELPPEIVRVYRHITGEYADCYVDEFLVSRVGKIIDNREANEDEVREALEDPYLALKVFFGHYAFARRGKDRDDLSADSQKALELSLQGGSFESVLAQEDGEAIWTAFEEVTQERRKKSNEVQNRGTLQGMLELCQEIYDLDPTASLATWIVNGVAQSGRLEPQFERIVDIRGIGPKSTSTFLRDIVYLFGLERNVHPADRIYYLPVDRWTRMIAPYIVPEDNITKAADWVLAGTIGKYARIARVSMLRFNMGLVYFGQRVVREPGNFEEAIRELAFRK
ncbi:MAG: hypothetical protein R2688_01720 [Fimbriimonadaceae bacterium]